MSNPFHTRRRVEFRETDAAGIMHFSAFFDAMEQAEHAFWRHLGLSVMTGDAAGPISWPRAAARCDFHSAVRFEDELDVELRIERVGQKSITFGFTFRHDDRLVASGELTAVCCRLSDAADPESIAIPDWIREKLPDVASA